MLRAISAIAALLLATAILYSGNGLQNTLLSVRAGIEGFPTALIGFLGSAYFVGFIAGCRYGPGIIKSSGHIRTFVALASVASASALAHALFVNFALWAVLRVITGFCFAGLAMVLESWINERATNENRGRILSVYRIIDLTALTLGNTLLTIASPAEFKLFALVSILISIALVPIALTRTAAPKPVSKAALDLPKLFAVSPVAAIGALFTGLANASFWGMGPVYVQRLGFGPEQIGAFMSACVIGAAVLQWPLGWWSDRVDRRVTLTAASAIAVAGSFSLSQFDGLAFSHLASIGFVAGGFIIPMFGICIAHANDHADPDEAVSTNGGLLLLHGVGSALGVSLGAGVMGLFGATSLFVYIAIIYAAFAAFCLFRIAIAPALSSEEKSAFVPVAKNAAPTVFEIAEQDDEEAAAPDV